ncbi:hypothetical protein EWM64_g2162 [Hericium alpestre]|uniref:Protein-serine/threonine kinase n=1 Tax=Hericium alpestre TaxID=135208 RepID=A0A4Z0A5W4_9AGAM|nr:hypothetical protein EWM64_g2162 [Hericium alpestre]
MQALPYVVVMQEGIAGVYELYWTAFEKFRQYPQVETLEDNNAFCTFLRNILDEHAVVIPSLTLGLSLASPYLDPDQLDTFMRRMLVSRISRRVLAEHHIALSNAFSKRAAGNDHVGIIYTDLSVKESVKKCAKLLRENLPQEDGGSKEAWPEIVIDGHLDTKFAYLREHLEYIVFELLKNAIQATIALHGKDANLPSIRVTIVAGEDDIGMRISDQGGGLITPQIKSPSDLFSFSHIRNASRLEDSRLGNLRSASTHPKGMRATVEEQVRRWQEERLHRHAADNPEMEAGVGPHPKLGIGLPMSNIFATYFGGSIEMVSLDGWGEPPSSAVEDQMTIHFRATGTDVYLRLPKLGTNLEGIEL